MSIEIFSYICTCNPQRKSGSENRPLTQHEFCEREGEAVSYRKGDQMERKKAA